MTRFLFYKDSYLQKFQTSVTDIDAESNSICLAETAFYPGGGGQPADHGVLEYMGQKQAVLSLKKDGDKIWHFVDGEVPEVGTVVTGEIEWEHRYKLMRTHTAMHILCGVVWRDHGAQVTGGNMEPLAGRMDFEFETLHQDLVHEIEEKVNIEVNASRAVKTAILPREEAFTIPDLIRTKINLLPEGIREVRTVEIVGLDLQADGGTHVSNTAEVGKIRVAGYKSKGKINKRIMIELES
jgi:misacylated tRNA(Ala) deacylase